MGKADSILVHKNEANKLDPAFPKLDNINNKREWLLATFRKTCSVKTKTEQNTLTFTNINRPAYVGMPPPSLYNHQHPYAYLKCLFESAEKMSPIKLLIAAKGDRSHED